MKYTRSTSILKNLIRNWKKSKNAKSIATNKVNNLNLAFQDENNIKSKPFTNSEQREEVVINTSGSRSEVVKNFTDPTDS
jgi:hypothetical protein